MRQMVLGARYHFATRFLMLVLWQERAERFDASTLLYLAVVSFNEV